MTAQSMMGNISAMTVLVFVWTIPPSIYSSETADEIVDWMTKCAILTSLLEGVEDVKAVMRNQEFVDQCNEIERIQERILAIMNENDCLPPLKDEEEYEMGDFS